jgi:sensor histidine kinase YesM
LFFAPQRKYQINAYLLMPQSVLTENQSALNQVTLVVCALIVLLFSLLFMLMSRSLTHPLTDMVNAMRRIQAGEKNLRMQNTHRDEFGQLGEAFNGMLDQIDLQTRREMRSQQTINEARYKALQAQINPHFLYNTLDTMSGIASVRHAEMVAVLCRALSNMFRYSLDMRDPFAPIAEELAHLKNYMLIIGVRTQGGIELDVDIPQALLDCRLPRLTLQPLVENAIQHGLKNKRGDKRVWVRARREAGALLISVEDNGVGMDTERINRMLDTDDEDALNKAGSIGLSNIHARLRLLLGSGSGLRVADAPNGGGIVTLRLEDAREAVAEDD